MAFSIRRALGVAVMAAAASGGPLAAQAAQGQGPQISIGALVYTQYTYQLKDTVNHLNRFDVTRAYVNVLARFSGGLYARVTADIFTNTDSSRAYRIKYAYVAYTPLNSPLTFKIGEIHQAWLDWEEALWDYRMQGQMAMERAGYLSASVFGAGVDGKWGPDKVNMQFVVQNDANYNKGTGDQRKVAQARVSARVMDTDDSSRVGGLRVTGYADYGNAIGGGERQRYLAMVSYKSKQATLAGEAVIARDGPLATRVNGHLYSAFGVYKIPQSKAAIIGRVDIWHAQVPLADKQTRFIGGVSYQLHPNWRLLADWDYLTYQQPTTVAQDATRSQLLFQTQLSF